MTPIPTPLNAISQVLSMRFMKGGSRPSTPAPPTGFSLLDAAIVVKGDLETSASLRIDGRVEGSVRRADVVVLGVGATMSGDIHAREVVVGGTLTGSIHAAERVELQATAIVTGDLVAQSVLVQEGGVVNGRVLMRPPGDAGIAAGTHRPGVAMADGAPMPTLSGRR